MKVAVVYVFPMVSQRTFYPLAARFADTFRRFPPGFDHELHICCNGGSALDADRHAFANISCEFHSRDNVGWDIGSYQWAAENIPCDLLVCFGSKTHFYREGWLRRMADAYLENGPALYGCWGYLYPNWHIRTTVFWLPPALLNSYPYVIGNARGSRYGFEHGPESITRWSLRAGLGADMVTWNEIFHHPWEGAKYGIGDCLVLDRFTHQ